MKVLPSIWPASSWVGQHLKFRYNIYIYIEREREGHSLLQRHFFHQPKYSIAMCPPARVAPDNIGLYWTDEEVFMHLERMIQGGSSFPGNVIKDVNPYQQLPSNLHDGIWYFIRSEQRKDSEHGFWKAKGDAYVIFTNSTITGWRTTLEFHAGRAPHGQRTNWVMQEYRITKKGLRSNNSPKEPSLLCRVFLSSGPSPNREIQHKLGGADIAGSSHFHPKPSIVADVGSSTGQGCTSNSQGRNRDDKTGPLAAAGELPHIPVENMSDIDCFLRGDYIELDDLLAEPESHCSNSDEYFDSWALMHELEDEINRNDQQQGKNANSKFSIAASSRPNEVVMHPATLVSVISTNERKSPAEAINKKLPDKRVSESAIKRQKTDDRKEGTSNSQQKTNDGKKGTSNSQQKTNDGKEGTSNSHTVATSSSTNKAVLGGEKKAQVGVPKKLKKNYDRFFPF